MRRIFSALSACLLLFAGQASAQLQSDWRGFVQSDIRLNIDEDMSFRRLETTANGRYTARYGSHVGGVIDLELVYTEASNPGDLAGLFNRSQIDPWRLESDALFVEFTDAGLDGLDIRLGRQQLIWGAADRFHPTSNLNPLDVEDGLEFGDTIANEMVTISYRPYFWFGDEDDPWFEEFGIELAVVPSFKPAQLPRSAGFAFTSPDEQIRLATTDELKQLANQQKGYLDAGADIAYDVNVKLPDWNARNIMLGARMSWNLLGVDMSVSYFRGFDDFPRAENAIVTGDATDVHTAIDLTYPRVQVLGVDMAASVPWLDGMGVWAEVGITFHDDLHVLIDGARFAGNASGDVFPNGPALEHSAGQFVKAVAGIDYTPFPFWYINIQYLHGFVDEFGADNLNDYIVAGMDFKLFRDKFLIRTFGIVDLEDQSWVLFPQLVFRPFSGGSLSIGSFLFFGDDDTKFGSPVAGGSMVFSKARFSF